MELMPGYMHSECGVIPKAWKVVPVRNLIESMRGGLSRRLEARDIGIPVITSANIHNNRLKIDELKYWYLNDPQGANVNDYVLNNGDILLCYINSLAQIGKPCIFKDIGRPAIYTTNIFRIVSSKECDSIFLYYLFCSTSFQQAIQLIAKPAVNQASFTKPDFFKISVVIPTITEQLAIAKALSDIDMLLVTLEELMIKKRDLKQAFMQQLLTGKTRLPGFRGEWVQKRIDQIAEIRSGGTPSTSQSNLWGGDIPWCTPVDVTALKGYKYICETSRMITQLGLNESSVEIIPAQSVLMTSRATIGECAINTVPMTTNQGFKNLIPFETTDVNFLYYLLQMQKQGLVALCGGSTFLEIGKKQIAAYEVFVPSTKDEQTAIATVLSEMDDELTLIEVQLNKTRDLKLAMMQELLTGKTRLIDKERCNA